MSLEAVREAAALVTAHGFEEAFSLPPGRALDICLNLQRAILEHRLGPGTKLSEDEVGEIYGASRTVVRAALQALAHSGLVAIERNRGAFVSRPTIREAHEVFEARALIEPRVARTAAQLMTDDDVARLKAHIDAEHVALHAGDMGKALSLSGLFHIAIADIAQQQIFARMVRSLISRSSLIIGLYWKRADTACESHSHHALIQAFADRDATQADELMKSHIVDLHSGLDLVEKPSQALPLAQVLGPR
ncbi:GntR family transcriptional regulator [Breoghania sp. L-A4]|uniref:GntR family transcriptional regulator n=1 Tax=Breoghania sp. L-A4 TaxID=2304600 RepID=UPI000E360A13|nr:GntR family transcriptional regulator [Breoghania sp. L-A4]AXS41691.1 GntR family transcriptional regulator [Breoghania sp. L-A4]